MSAKTKTRSKNSSGKVAFSASCPSCLIQVCASGLCPDVSLSVPILPLFVNMNYCDRVSVALQPKN
ncbi:exported hypothetical protein [Agrobacterium fabacearum CFBP 5771]|nr:exported hypothetical protein [Agrobacterium fabacearum CFBP 5771]